MVQSGIQIPGAYIAFEDIASVFKAVAELFNSRIDPDRKIVQNKLLLTNEVTEAGLWRSRNNIELSHSIKRGLRLVYHYNSEALTNQTVFKSYRQDVGFVDLPPDVESTIFFIGRGAVQNRGDHRTDSKDAMGFIALFSTPIPPGAAFSYYYTQSYRTLFRFWDGDRKELFRDFRFIRETTQFTRVLKFPAKYYAGVVPSAYLLDSAKSKRLRSAERITIDRETTQKTAKWTIRADSPPRGSVLRIKWARP